MEWETTSYKRMKVSLGVPFIYRIYKLKKAHLLKAKYEDGFKRDVFSSAVLWRSDSILFLKTTKTSFWHTFVFVPSSQRLFTVPLLDRYRKALETAVQISCRYNVPPLSGRTLILLSTSWSDGSWNQKQDFCLPPDPEQQNNEEAKEEKEEQHEEEEEEEDKQRRREKKKKEADELTPSVSVCSFPTSSETDEVWL